MATLVIPNPDQSDGDNEPAENLITLDKNLAIEPINWSFKAASPPTPTMVK